MLEVDRTADPNDDLETVRNPRLDAACDSTESRATPGTLALIRRRWVGPAVFVVCGVVLFFALLAQASTAAASSESSGQALQAWDMLHGNLLLHGWSLSDVSFYTTELPEYMLVEVVHGLNVETVHVAAALSYTLTLLLAALLAKGRATGREATVRMLIAGGIMLAPSLGLTTHVLLGNPDHMGTHVPLLIIYLVLDRVRPRWWVPLLVAALLTWAQIADTLVLFEGALPLALACAIRMCRRRGAIVRQSYDAMLAGGALISAVAARVVLHVINAAGGFYVKTPVAEFKTLSALPTMLGKQLVNVLHTFGADFSGAPAAPFPGLVHLIGFLLVVVALCIGVRRLWRDSDLIVQMLCIAFVLVFAAYLVSTQTEPNEIVGLLPIGAVLAGRVLGSRVGRPGGGRPAPSPGPDPGAGSRPGRLHRDHDLQRQPVAGGQSQRASCHLAADAPPRLRAGRLLERKHRDRGQRRPHPGAAGPAIQESARNHGLGIRCVLVRPASPPRQLCHRLAKPGLLDVPMACRPHQGVRASGRHLLGPEEHDFGLEQESAGTAARAVLVWAALAMARCVRPVPAGVRLSRIPHRGTM